MSASSGKRSASYQLAMKGRPALVARVETLIKALNGAGCDAATYAFLHFLTDRGQAGINMSIRNCLRFLKSGAWLSIYEAVHEETGKVGDELEVAVRQRLEAKGVDWYERRKHIEKLFRFDHHTHYAALNVGGEGAQRYGDCCVLIDWPRWSSISTCFGGDTLREHFTTEGELLAVDTEMLQLFAIGKDLDKLALIKHEQSLRMHAKPPSGPPLYPPGFNQAQMRNVMEGDDSLIELHLHGAVTDADVRAIVMSQKRVDELWRGWWEWEAAGKPKTHRFESVRYFVELNALIESNPKIRLITPEGS